MTTQELWARLFQTPTLDRFLEEQAGAAMPTFSEYINELCRSRGEKPGIIIRRSDLDSSFGHRLFSGARNPSRDTVLKLAFGFQCTPDEAQELLKVARATALHPKVKRDAVIAYCLHCRNTVVEAQQALFDNGLPLMGGVKDGQQ